MSKKSKRARTSPRQEPKQKKSTFGAFKMKDETLIQLLNEFSERNEAARKEDRDYLRRGIDDILKDIKEIKDNVINLKRRMSDTESEISKIKENRITREELSEIQWKKSEVIIFGLPELENDLKTAVLDKLNKVTPTSMEEIKFIRRIGKASNGKIQPTLAWWCSEVQQSVKSSSRGPTKSHTVLNLVSQKTNKCTIKN
jgi:formyltetrahydrofolate synthetase